MLSRAMLWLLAAAVVPFVALTRADACTYSLSPAAISVPATGTTATVAITTQTGCYWMVSLGVTWITPISGFQGMGSGQFTFSVPANTSTAQRTGQVFIADQTLTVTQAGAGTTCSYSISPTTASVAASGATGSVAVTAATGCAWTAASNATWINITGGTTGSGNGAVNYSVTGNASTSSRTGTLTIAGQTFTVSQAAAVPAGPVPTLPAGGVVNAADDTANFAPGMIISLYGSNLATATTLASSIPLPNSLSGASVEIVDGSTVLNAPLIYASAAQINAQLPFNMTSSSVQVRVRNAQGVSSTQTIAITPRCPRLFTQTRDGKGEAVVLHADYSVVAANSPAAPGETVILFLTGLGAVSPSIAAGQAGGDGTPGKPLNLVSGVTVTVGGTSTYVSFSGLAPGFAGLYQVNFQVPTGAAGPLANIVVSAGSQASQTGVAFAVGSKNAQLLGSATVGPQGGTVSAGPVTLTVPSGAFSSSATINVSRATGGATADPSAFGDTYAMTGVPASTAGSMTVAIQTSGALPSGGEPYMVVTESDGGSLYVPAQAQGNLVTATLPPRPGTFRQQFRECVP